MVENGHSAEENHVSSVSLSCLSPSAPHFGQRSGACLDTSTAPQLSQ
jgi:hypothetical protein